MLVVQDHRPELVPKLENTIGAYEMSVVARAFSAVDGSLHIPMDKSSLMKAIINYSGHGEELFESNETGIEQLFNDPSQDQEYFTIGHDENAEDACGDNRLFNETDPQIFNEDLSNNDESPNEQVIFDKCRPTKVKIIDEMAVLHP